MAKADNKNSSSFAKLVLAAEVTADNWEPPEGSIRVNREPIDPNRSMPVPLPPTPQRAMHLDATLPLSAQLDADLKPQGTTAFPTVRLFPVQPAGRPEQNSAIASQLTPVTKIAQSAASSVTSIGNTSVVSVSSSGAMQQGSLNRLPVAPRPVSSVTQDNLGDGLNFKRLLHVNADNTLHASTALNNNGNMPASNFPANNITVKTSGVSGASASIQWAGAIGTLMDGSTVVLGVGSYSAPPAPTLSQHSGGTRGATTLFVRLALLRDNVIMAVGPEASIAVAANNQISVTSPSAVAGMDGWIPLISAATLNEFVPNDRVNGSFPLVFITIPFGTDYSEPSGGWTAKGQSCNNWAVPITTASGTSLAPTQPLLTVITTYFIYPSYDLVNTMMCFPSGSFGTDAPGFGTAKDSFRAIAQCGDQRVALSTGAISLTTPASGNTGSTTGGGGGGGGRGLQ